MRFQGIITRWKDDQGFGFVTKNATGDQAFAHIKAFSSPSRRPVEGDVVTYELAKDERGRPRAVSVEFVARRSSPKPTAKPLKLGSEAESFSLSTAEAKAADGGGNFGGVCKHRADDSRDRR